MKRARSQDSVDQACAAWAQVRRELVGLAQPQLASGYLGAMRCTLGQRRDLHAGARSDGRIEQHFPEVYPPGLPTAINRVWREMPLPLKAVMDVHYVVESPRSRSMRAAMIGISPREYWRLVSRVKDRVSGAMAVDDFGRTLCA